MATPALIDLSNYNTLLVQSTQARSGTPDGNIFFNTTTGEVELITAEEAANVTYPVGHPNYTDGLPEANPMTNALGCRFEALYAFERKERRIDETLRTFDYFFSGTFKFGGAYQIVNGRKFAATDRAKIRGSGWNERSSGGLIDRIYYGNVSLGNVEAASQPYYQLTAGGAPTNYAKVGPLDEAIQVFGTTANGDAGAGDFDSRTYLSIKLRTFGFNYDEKQLADSGVTEMGGYSTGFALGESAHLTSGSYALADVYGGGQVSPWTGMQLEKVVGAVAGAQQIDITASTSTITRIAGDFSADGFAPGMHVTLAGFVNGGNNANFILATVGTTTMTVTDNTGMVDETGSGDETATSIAQPVTGFNESDGNFTWVLRNAASGDLDQMVAFLDALAQTDDDIDTGALTVTNGQRVGTWYSYDAQGRIVTNAPFSSEGLFLEAVPTADQQSVVFTDDAAATKTYPFTVSVNIEVGANAVSDANAWCQGFFLDGPAAADFNTAAALTVEDGSAVEWKFNSIGATPIVTSFDYDGDTIGGTAGTNKDVVLECEGDGGATAAKTVFTLTRTATINVTCAPGLETNV